MWACKRRLQAHPLHCRSSDGPHPPLLSAKDSKALTNQGGHPCPDDGSNNATHEESSSANGGGSDEFRARRVYRKSLPIPLSCRAEASVASGA